MNWSVAYVHWKSSAAGLLNLVIVTSGALAGFSMLSVKHASIVALAGSLARAYVGLISQDSGTVLAKVPGDPIPQAVASTEIPIDPKNKVVK